MIKELIADLGYEKISVKQALIRAKIISFKLGDERLAKWIKSELNSYGDADEVPSYRVLSCSTHIEYLLPMAGPKFQQIVAEKGTNTDELVSQITCVMSIPALEEQLKETSEDFAKFEMSGTYANEFYDALSPLNPSMADGKKYLKGIFRRVGISDLRDIVEQTKLRLLDTLLELDKQFPDLENYFPGTQVAKDQANNIITTNIYGGNNPINIATGDNSSQCM